MAEAVLAMDAPHTTPKSYLIHLLVRQVPAGQTCWWKSSLHGGQEEVGLQEDGLGREQCWLLQKKGAQYSLISAFCAACGHTVTLAKVLSISETHFSHSKPGIANPTSYACGDER